jgi:hypothetical protein
MTLLPIYMEGKEIKLEKTHRVMGFVMANLSLALFIGGLSIKCLKEKLSTWRTHKILKLAKLHRYLGYFAISGAHLTMFYGIKAPKLWIFFSYLIPLLLVLLWLELRYRKQCLKFSPLQMTDNLEIISAEQFKRSVWREGKHWVILDDLVLDISEYQTRHPGGKFFLEHNRGRDVSKYFYGGYKMEAKSSA